MSHPLLSTFGYFDAPRDKKLVAAVFVMDRILVADERAIAEEWDQFEKIANELSSDFTVEPKAFGEELKRQFGILQKLNLTDGLLLRMTREAIGLVDSELTQGLKPRFLAACRDLALSDAQLHKRELMILYDLASACTGSVKDLRAFFAEFQQDCRERFPADHPVQETLNEMLDIVRQTSSKARMALIQRPDEVRESLIPPLSLTYEEFADWVTTVSFLRAARHRQAPMNHTRTSYTVGNMTAQKGLIKLVSVVDDDDEQLVEAHEFVRQWCAAVRDNEGNFPFPDGQVFSVCIFGSNGDDFNDCCLPNKDTSGLWYITCMKQAQTIEVHAFDISGDKPSTYWCPEMADKLSLRLEIPQLLVDGTYPMDDAGRMRTLKKAISAFKAL